MSRTKELGAVVYLVLNMMFGALEINLGVASQRPAKHIPEGKVPRGLLHNFDNGKRRENWHENGR